MGFDFSLAESLGRAICDIIIFFKDIKTFIGLKNFRYVGDIGTFNVDLVIHT